MIPATRRLLARRGPNVSGFSLVEMLVSLAIFSVVLSMVFAFLTQARENLETEAAGVEAQHGARVALEELVLQIQQAGFGVERPHPSNSAAWQQAIVHAGASAFAFNADLDPALGTMSSDVELSFPDGSTYVGEGDDEADDGAETYHYTLDANDDGRISAADRWATDGDSYNPAAQSDNPLDYALFRRVYGSTVDGPSGREDALTPHLFTGATATDDFADGSSAEPLFRYWLSEDLNGDDRLADAECVIEPCPSSGTRKPRVYLWGDTDFDGVHSELEKDALRDLPVGSPDWARNPVASGGNLHSTVLSDDADSGAKILEVADAANFTPGQHVNIGRAPSAERVRVASADSDSSPNVIGLATGLKYSHDQADRITVAPETLLRAIRTVQISFGAIRPARDLKNIPVDATSAEAGRVGARGLDYRVVSLERRIGLPNLRTQPMGAQ